MLMWIQESVWNRVLLERFTNLFIVWTGLKTVSNSLPITYNLKISTDSNSGLTVMNMYFQIRLIDVFNPNYQYRGNLKQKKVV